MRSLFFILTLFLTISLATCRVFTRAKTTQYIFLDMEKGSLKQGDNVVLEGEFVKKRIVQIRFMSSPTACQGGILKTSKGPHQCQPIIVLFFPNLHKMKVFYKGEVNNHRDILLYESHNANIGPGKHYNLTIKVGEHSYALFLQDDYLTTVSDTIGHESVIKMRAYGGRFSDFKVFKPTQRVRAAQMCGYRQGIRAAVRIIRGRDAGAGEYPWQAAIRRRIKQSWAPVKHICGASLINPCWILTAAHCLLEVEGHLEDYQVRVGDYYNRNDSRGFDSYEDEQDLDIERIFVHPNFTAYPSPKNDIGLIKIVSGHCADTRTDFVQPICLPTPDDNFPINFRCEISGWGAKHETDSPENFPKKLQKADIRIQNHGICREQYGRDSTDNYRVANETICASDRGVDACQGDSGGPLACQRPDNPHSFVLWGITSWGDGCASSVKPHGVYTKVVDYLDWINQVMTGRVRST